MGSRVLSSGNSEKSRSRVRSVSTPWATQIAAILASWTTPPLTRGRRTKRSSIPGKPSVSPNQPQGWRSDPSGELTPRLARTGGVLLPDARVGHHTAGFIATGPGNGPHIVAFSQITHDRGDRLAAPWLAPVGIHQQVGVDGDHLGSGLSVYNPSKVLPGVRLQGVPPARLPNALVG